MNHFYAFWLAFLELNFIFIVLSLLHSQRRLVGNAPFYLSIGMVFLFAQLVAAAGLEMQMPFFGENWVLPLGQTVLFTPYLAALLLVYVCEGVLSMQRLVIGAVVVLGLFFYLGELTAMQCGWAGYSSSLGLSSEALRQLLTGTRRSMLAMVLVQVVDMFLLPVIFTRLRKSSCSLFVCFLGALLFTQLIDTLLYQLLLENVAPAWWTQWNATFVVRGLSAVWVSLLLTMYVMKIEGASEVETLPTSSFEMIYAFFGGYGRSKNLEKDLLDSEWRYRNVIESASEMVILLDRSGRVIEANPAAAQMLGRSVEALQLSFIEQFMEFKGPGEMDLAAKTVLESDIVIRCKARLKNQNEWRFALTTSPFMFRGIPMLIVLGRDVSDEIRLAEERERLSDQLAHSQRIEAIGQLAGGVAHDFNNHIHAILGNVDLALMSDDIPEDVQVHLEKIALIAEQAGKVTGQLLGFARKGKYQVTLTDLRTIVEKSMEMFNTNRSDSLEISVSEIAYPMPVQGDAIQLQQVLINLLINGRDAVSSNPAGKLRISGGEAALCPGGFFPEAGEQTESPEDYWYIAVSDNGCGISNEVKQHVFEPFFTTKPVGRGTGMGLAMVYGTVRNHHGWVQLDSMLGVGTTFYLFFPKSAPIAL